MEIVNSKYIDALKIDHVSKFHDQTELIDIVWPNFVEIEGCIIINKVQENQNEINIDHIIKQFGDRSGFEAAESHVHMKDVSKTFKKFPLEGLRFAKKIMDMWSTKLKLDFPMYKFLVILTFHDDDTILRWVNIDKIDEYSEGIFLRII